jgi:adenylosuccinate lyase
MQHACEQFGGATGNFNAHAVAFPAVNWNEFANHFIANLGLARQQVTTQIEHYDNMAALMDAAKRINNILLDFCRDVWAYISMGVFKQRPKAGEIGSSAMPHKVNPIDFENAEGNLGVANALFEHLSSKLPISRLQRDLTDSTVTRNVGVPFGHTLVAFKSIHKGLSKVYLDEACVRNELNRHWEVVAEAIQTILRREQIDGAYELLKEETRGVDVTPDSIAVFVEKLGKRYKFLTQETLDEISRVTPENYTGVFVMPEPLEQWTIATLDEQLAKQVLPKLQPEL